MESGQPRGMVSLWTPVLLDFEHRTNKWTHIWLYLRVHTHTHTHTHSGSSSHLTRTLKVQLTRLTMLKKGFLPKQQIASALLVRSDIRWVNVQRVWNERQAGMLI